MYCLLCVLRTELLLQCLTDSASSGPVNSLTFDWQINGRKNSRGDMTTQSMKWPPLCCAVHAVWCGEAYAMHLYNWFWMPYYVVCIMHCVSMYVHVYVLFDLLCVTSGARVWGSNHWLEDITSWQPRVFAYTYIVVWYFNASTVLHTTYSWECRSGRTTDCCLGMCIYVLWDGALVGAYLL